MRDLIPTSRFLYPGIVVLLVSSVSFPLGLGQFTAGDLTTHQQVSNLFSNFTWTKGNLSVEEQALVAHWTTPYTGIYVNLVGFVLFTVIAIPDARLPSTSIFLCTYSSFSRSFHRRFQFLAGSSFPCSKSARGSGGWSES